MSKIHITTPILICADLSESSRQRTYECSPLFYPHLSSSHHKLSVALTSLKNTLSDRLRTRRDDAESLPLLMWLQLNPPLEVTEVTLDFRSSSKHIYGSVNVITFEVNSVCFGLLPTLDRQLFIMRLNERGRPSHLAQQVRDHVQSMLRDERDASGDDLRLREMIQRNIRPQIQLITFAVHPPRVRYPRDHSEASNTLSMNLFGERKMRGDQEVYKVARDLNSDIDLNTREYGDADNRRALYELMYREDNQPIVVLGPAKVGKTHIILSALRQHLREHPLQDDEPDKVEKLWHLDPQRVISGMSIVGAWQKRFEAILTYITTRSRASITSLSSTAENDHHTHRPGGARPDLLFIDQPLALLQVGKSQGSDLCLATLLKPHLERGDFQLVVEMTPAAWAKFKQLDQPLADLFLVFPVKPMSLSETTALLSDYRIDLEERHQCRFTVNALRRLMSLHQAFLRGQTLPGGVIELAESLAHLYRQREVTEERTLQYFAERFSISAELFDPKQRIDSEHLRSQIYSGLIGQPEAAEALINIVHLIKSGLKSPHKPISTLLFAGPTGVGKTEAAKVITRYLFKSEAQMIRFDMNEYIDASSAVRLIGDLNNPEGLLTAQVRHKPFCVLLLDEIEKAHSSVHDLLLQVLGEGRLSDSRGQLVDFTNTIIIMTSNVGAREAKRGLGFESGTEARIKARYLSAVEELFRPELVNRIDHIIAFSPLNLLSAMEISRLLIQRLLKRDGFLRRTAMVSISEDVARDVAQRGFDPELGGRALKRFIERELAMLSAQKMAEVPPDGVMIYELMLEREEVTPLITPLERVERLARVPQLTLTEPQRIHVVTRTYESLSAQLSSVDRAIDQLKALSSEDGGQGLGDDGEGFSSALNLDGLISDLHTETLDEVRPLGDASTQALERAPSQALMRLYLMRDAGLQLIEELREYVLREGERISEIAISPQLVTPTQISSNDWYGRDRHFSEKRHIANLREFVEEHLMISQREPELRDLTRTLAQVVFLSGQLRQLDVGRERGCLLLIRSLITKRGQPELSDFADRYLYMLSGLDIQGEVWVSPREEEPALMIYVNVIGAYDWLKGERGVHLFYPPFGLPTPLHVEVSPLHTPSDVTLTRDESTLADSRAQLSEVLAELITRPCITRSPRPMPIVRLYTRSERPDHFASASTIDDRGASGERLTDNIAQESLLEVSSQGSTEFWVHTPRDLDEITQRLKRGQELITDHRSGITAYAHHLDQWMSILHAGLEPEHMLSSLIEDQDDSKPSDASLTMHMEADIDHITEEYDP